MMDRPEPAPPPNPEPRPPNGPLGAAQRPAARQPGASDERCGGATMCAVVRWGSGVFVVRRYRTRLGMQACGSTLPTLSPRMISGCPRWRAVGSCIGHESGRESTRAVGLSKFVQLSSARRRHAWRRRVLPSSRSCTIDPRSCASFGPSVWCARAQTRAMSAKASASDPRLVLMGPDSNGALAPRQGAA
jgi:hypothetical protein